MVSSVGYYCYHLLKAAEMKNSTLARLNGKAVVIVKYGEKVCLVRFANGLTNYPGFAVYTASLRQF
jgi:hypothetical protein